MSSFVTGGVTERLGDRLPGCHRGVEAKGRDLFRSLQQFRSVFWVKGNVHLGETYSTLGPLLFSLNCFESPLNNVTKQTLFFAF